MPRKSTGLKKPKGLLRIGRISFYPSTGKVAALVDSPALNDLVSSLMNKLTGK